MLDRDAQADESVVAQAAALHEGGVRVRTLSLFYEEWLGKLPVSELERVSLMFDIGEVHRVRYGRLKRLARRRRRAWPALVALVVVTPLVVARQPGRPTAVRCSTARTASARAASRFTILKFRTMRAAGERRTATSGPSRTTPASPASAGSCGVTHLDELPQVVNILARRPLDRRAPPRAARATSPS